MLPIVLVRCLAALLGLAVLSACSHATIEPGRTLSAGGTSASIGGFGGYRSLWVRGDFPDKKPNDLSRFGVPVYPNAHRGSGFGVMDSSDGRIGIADLRTEDAPATVYAWYKKRLPRASAAVDIVGGTKVCELHYARKGGVQVAIGITESDDATEVLILKGVD